MIASTVPTWLAVLSGVIGAFAGALGALASLLMSFVNYKRLNEIHATVKTALRARASSTGSYGCSCGRSTASSPPPTDG